MKKLYTLLFVFAMFPLSLVAQTGTEFWFAAPEVTHGHNDNGPKFRFTNTSKTLTANVTVTMPAQAWNVITPTPIVIAPSGTATLVLDVNPNNYVDTIENKPTNTVLNKGIHITSDVAITAYYEQDNNNNNEIFALKGANGLGTEFYIPLTRNTAMFNHTPLTPSAYSTFDIVATQNATIVQIFTRVPVDGHPANVPFSITLNQGQTYSCGWTGTGFEQSVNQPSGAVVLSDKPIAITVKEDSRQYGAYTCYDLIGDQIVPVDIVGTEYVVIKGQLNANAGESFYILATENNTKVYINGNATPVATLFAGQTYAKDSLTLPRYFIQTDKPAYCTQVTGFGCELGSAILPPLNCAGSSTVSFVRSTNESFYLNLMVKNGSQGNFKLYGGSDSLCITAGDFAVVPGTGGEWYSTYGKQFTLPQVPVGVAMRLVNSTDVFGMGLINGGSTSGCRYGFFSEFAARIIVDAGPVQSICSDQNAQLNGSVSGGVTTGQWTSSGTGFFTPNNTTMNAQYVPGMNDILNGSVTLTLTSTGMCFPETDATTITFQQAPAVNAGVDQSVCSNNPNVVLSGSVANALGGIWSGGAGSFNPNNTSVNAVYTPTPAEVAAGSLTLTLTSTGNGICNPQSDIVVITFSPSPTAFAGADQTICANNANVTLNGSVTVATGGIWTGGAGSYTPSNITLGAVYTPSPLEIAAGTFTLTLTTTGNGNCNAVTDNVTYTITPSPIAEASVNQTACGNNPTVTLNGSVINASGGQWTGGLGLFSPNANTLGATYTPTAGEIAAGSVNLILTTTGNGSCNPVTDNMTVTYTTAPTINAGPDQSVCANNPNVTLNASVTIATGGVWSGGSGTYLPNNSSLNITYIPSAAEIAAGSVTLTISSSGNGSCNPVSDAVIITITPSPVVNAGADYIACVNNPTVLLNGSVTNATGGLWTGGNGVYNPSSAVLNATYTPTPLEISSGLVTLTLTSTGNGNCNPVADYINITFTPSPVTDAGPNQIKCANNAVTTLSGSVVNASGGIWSGGLGIFSPNNSALNATYTPTAADILAGSVTLTLTSSGNGTCNPVSDVMTISFTPAPTANAGTDLSVCANNPSIALNGNYTVASGAQWSGGTGTYSPGNTSMGAVYTPSATEIAAGGATLTLTTTGNGTCNAVSDNVHITITASPTANAGPDKMICRNNPNVNLHGLVTIATGGVWSGGAGVYNPNNADLNAVYTPTPAEIVAGSLTLTLTTTGNGNCYAVTDQITINFTPEPVVNAGVDQTVCANTNVNLFGTVVLASGGIWSGGLGLFTPGNNVLNPTYTPSTAETMAGFVNLTLTSTGNGTCNAVSDVVRINFTPAPTVSAGADQVVCANNAHAVLTGNVTIASGGIWTTSGSGSFSPSNISLNTTYNASASDIAAGSVTIRLTTTGNGTCNPVLDSMKITFSPAPAVQAGSDQTVCVDNLFVSLNGLISGGATTGIWSTSGSGTFIPNNTMLGASYHASTADSLAHGVTLILTSTNNGDCLPVVDSMHIFIFPAGVANAGSDATVCANNGSVVLNGSVSGGAVGGTWSTSGNGTFVPNSSTLNATYNPGSADITAGTVQLILTANSCNQAKDTAIITITPAPNVDAGPDLFICSRTAPLNATINGATTTGIWTTLGTGTFSPDNITLNATYNASMADSVAGTVTLILTSTGNGNCIAVKDTLIVTITEPGFVNAGADQNVCSNVNVNLSGSITGGASQGVWTTSGTGSFIPSNTAINATYIPSAGDITVGSVMLTLTATNSCNPVFDNLMVTFIPAPTSDAGIDQTVCANNSVITLNGISSNSSSVLWTSSGSGNFMPNPNTLNVLYVPDAADISNGTVTLYLSANGNGGCAQVLDSMQLTITPAPVVNAGMNQSVCKTSQMTQLMGSVSAGSTTGIWTTLGSGSFVPDNVTMNTYYQFSSADTTAGSVSLILTSTNNGDCLPVSDTVVITFGNTTFVYAGPDQTMCGGSNLANLNGFVNGGSTSGQWVTLGTGSFFPYDTVLNTIYIISPADSLNGSVDIILMSTYNGTCGMGSDTLTIFIDKVPEVNAGNDFNQCFGTNVQLNGSVLYASGGQWSSSGTGSFIPDINTLNAQYLPSFADSIAGYVDLVLTTTGNGTCSAAMDTVRVTFLVPLIPDFNISTACLNQATSFTDNTTILSGSISSWLWDFGGGNLSNMQNASYVFTSTGTFMVTLTVQSNLGCSTSITKTITVNPSPVAAFSSNTVCSYENMNFTDLSTVSSGSINSWMWDFGDGDTAYVQSPQHIYNDDSLYSVMLIVTSDMGCTNSVSHNISFWPMPLANFSNTAGCANAGIQFTDFSVVSGGNINSWNWDFGNGSNAAIQNPTTQYSAGGNYNVTLVIQSDHGCRDTLVKPISIYPGPNADFSMSGDFTTGSVVEFTNLSTSGTSYNWNFGDGIGTSTIMSPLYTYLNEGTYLVTMIVTDANYCSDTATTNISIRQNIEVELYPPKVPTGFTPNGDGQNDVLYVRGGPFRYVEFKVFNAWGQEIFSTNDAALGWDGTWKDVDQPMAVYTYTVKATTVDEKTYTKSGNVTLIR